MTLGKALFLALLVLMLFGLKALIIVALLLFVIDWSGKGDGREYVREDYDR